jgi:Zn ribbon nucleic-acid-binding protein
MDITKVKRIFTTFDLHQANILLRCNWILLEIKDGKYVLGQIDKFRCPKCNTEIDYDKVNISNWEGLHIIECSGCGKEKIPYGVTLDQYFIDKITEYIDNGD